jgi:hypothetical protein
LIYDAIVGDLAAQGTTNNPVDLISPARPIELVARR